MLNQRIPQIFTLSHNNASAWESRGVVIKKEGMHFDTPSSFGDPLGARTQDPNIKSVVLYLLS